jgi:hypothetical protein
MMVALSQSLLIDENFNRALVDLEFLAGMKAIAMFGELDTKDYNLYLIGDLSQWGVEEVWESGYLDVVLTLSNFPIDSPVYCFKSIIAGLPSAVSYIKKNYEKIKNLQKRVSHPEIAQGLRELFALVNRKNKKVCVGCGKVDGAMSRCSRCMMNYCSRECQKRDWPSHKSDCKKKVEVNQRMAGPGVALKLKTGVRRDFVLELIGRTKSQILSQAAKQGIQQEHIIVFFNMGTLLNLYEYKSLNIYDHRDVESLSKQSVWADIHEEVQRQVDNADGHNRPEENRTTNVIVTLHSDNKVSIHSVFL